MGSYIARQPNGLYCRYSSVVECPTHFNMTVTDYLKIVVSRNPDKSIEWCMNEVKDVFENYLQPFVRVMVDTTELNMTEEEYIQFLEAVQEDE